METSEIMEQLKGLLGTKNQGEISRLKELLEFLQELKDKCREEIQENENAGQIKEQEVALKKSEMEHAERMKSLELGQPVPDKREIGKAHSAIWAAGLIGILVPLALIGAGITTSVLVLRPGLESSLRVMDFTLDRQVAMITVVWTLCGLLSLLIAGLSLRTIRRAREWLPPFPKINPSQSKLGEERPMR